MKANLVPGLVLQSFALIIAVCYFHVEEARIAFETIGLLKERHGFLFSAISTALFGGLVPFLVLLFSRRIPAGSAGRELAFYIGFWIWKGVEVDALYRGQAVVFGDTSEPTVILVKTIVDQFLYNPLWAGPTQMICFLWKDCGFSVKETLAQLRVRPFGQRTLTVLLSTWVVWVPAVAVIYALPGLLQLPLFNLVLCFWCLLLSFVSRSSG